MQSVALQVTAPQPVLSLAFVAGAASVATWLGIACGPGGPSSSVPACGSSSESEEEMQTAPPPSDGSVPAPISVPATVAVPDVSVPAPASAVVPVTTSTSPSPVAADGSSVPFPSLPNGS